MDGLVLDVADEDLDSGDVFCVFGVVGLVSFSDLFC